MWFIENQSSVFEARRPFTWASGIKSPIYGQPCDLTYPETRTLWLRWFCRKIRGISRCRVSLLELVTAGIPLTEPLLQIRWTCHLPHIRERNQKITERQSNGRSSSSLAEDGCHWRLNLDWRFGLGCYCQPLNVKVRMWLCWNYLLPPWATKSRKEL